MKPYGKENRLHRKCVRQQLGTINLVTHYYPLLETETGRFLWRVSQDDDNVVKHLKTYNVSNQFLICLARHWGKC